MTNKELLEQIYNERFGELWLGETECWQNLEVLAVELSDLVGKTPPWGSRYLYSILKYDDYSVSKKMVAALQTFAAIYFDDLDPLIAKLSRRIVYSINGDIKPGSIVLGHSVQCPMCGKWIVPRSVNGKYCDECRPGARQWRRKQRANNEH